MRSEVDFSVVSPTFDTSPDLVLAMAQSIADAARAAPDLEIELILTDDGSSPENRYAYEQIVEQQKAALPCSFVQSPTHRGIAAARNRGVSNASGEWICLVDSDDLVTADFFVALARVTEPWKSFIFTDHAKFSFDLDRRLERRSKELYARLLETHAGTLEDPFLHGTFLIHCHVLRRALFARVGMFDESIQYGDEIEFHLRCGRTLAPSEFGHLPVAVYRYRDNPVGVSSDPEKYAELIKTIEALLLAEARRRGLPATSCKRAGKRPDNSVAYTFSVDQP